MREYYYYIDHDDYATLVRDGCYGVEQISREEPVWQHGWDGYWREIYLGQGFGCLWEISLETAREYLSDWGLDPELAPEAPEPRTR